MFMSMSVTHEKTLPISDGFGPPTKLTHIILYRLVRSILKVYVRLAVCMKVGNIWNCIPNVIMETL